jgi:type VII secretion ATPase EccA
MAVTAAGRARAAWERAARLLKGGDYATPPPAETFRRVAREHLSRAVELDPAMADAWLGLHYLGVEQANAVEAMAVNLNRFGWERRRTSVPLASRFSGDSYWTLRLETRDQLYLAVATNVLAAETPDVALAESWLDRVSPGPLDPFTAHLRGRCRMATEDWAGAVPLFNQARTEEFVGPVARLLQGVCLWRAGAGDVARGVLSPLLRTSVADNLRAEASYFLGRIEEDRGEDAAARSHYGDCYAVNPGYIDVAARLSATAPRARVAAVPAPATHDSGGAADTPPTVAEALAEMDALVGLEPVKLRVRALVSQVRLEQRRVEVGMPVSQPTRHLVFAGPPGTGKTTVARIIGRMYASLGLLEDNTFVEASRSTLVGEYLGQTAVKTRSVVTSALGGVLFIDEAYQLQLAGLTGGDAFGTEAVGELLGLMENHRDRLLVVAAGYRDEMSRFLNANEGLRSRFSTLIDFPSYSPDELLEILERRVRSAGDTLAEGSRDVARQVFVQVCGDGMIDTLGNARFVRNLYEKAAESRALRHEHADVQSLSRAELSGILPEDLVYAAGATRLTG